MSTIIMYKQILPLRSPTRKADTINGFSTNQGIPCSPSVLIFEHYTLIKPNKPANKTFKVDTTSTLLSSS